MAKKATVNRARIFLLCWLLIGCLFNLADSNLPILTAYAAQERSGDVRTSAPITVRVTARIHDLEQHDGDGVWLIRLDDAAPKATRSSTDTFQTPPTLGLALAQVSSGWFGNLWGLHLVADAPILPPSLAPVAGSGFLQGTHVHTLRTERPVPGHVYEVALGYDGATGAAMVTIVDLTDDNTIVSRNLQLRPHDAPLHPGTSLHTASGHDAATDTFLGTSIGAIAELVHIATDNRLVPVSVLWWLMQKEGRVPHFVVASQLHRQKETALSVDIPWPDYPGQFHLALINSEGDVEISTGYEPEDDEFHRLSISDLPAGTYDAVLSFIDAEGTSWPVAREPIVVGVLQTEMVDATTTFPEGGNPRVTGMVRVQTDGPIPGAAIALEAETVTRSWTRNPAENQTVVDEQTTARRTVLPPVDLGDMARTTRADVRFSVELPKSMADPTATQLSYVNLYVVPTPSLFTLPTNPMVVWDSPTTDVTRLHGFLIDETIERYPVVAGVDVAHITGRLPEGPVRMHVGVVDLSSPCIRVDAFVGGDLLTPVTSRWPRSHISTMTARSGAILGINSAFFDINNTMLPIGLLMQGGTVMKSADKSFYASLGVTDDNRAVIGDWQWQGTLRVHGDAVPLRGLNVMESDGGVVLYASPAFRTPGFAQNNQGVEVVVKASGSATGQWKGTVKEIRRGQGPVSLDQDTFVIAATQTPNRQWLDRLAPGDEVIVEGTVVDVGPRRENAPDPSRLKSIVSGNVHLLQNGNYTGVVNQDTARHPRTAVGVTPDGQTLFILVAEGRSAASIGLTYKEIADFFLYVGALDALNLDGGGSSTFAVRQPGWNEVEVVNVLSDGRERYVPDGLGVFCR